MTKEECREQIQEDLICWMRSKSPTGDVPNWDECDDLCQIVVDNFKKMED